MTLNEWVGFLNHDLANEYTHMMFYTVHSSTLLGANRLLFTDFFKNHAKSEMVHATEFQDLIVGLGGVPAPVLNPVPVFANAEAAVKHAVLIEEEVVNNYVKRLEMVEADAEISSSNKLRIKLFLEGQFEDSRRDLEELNNLAFAFKG
jgi:bacterioferritin (cytochrome b1)